MNVRAVKTLTALALGSMLLAACVGQTPGGQTVPSDQDPSSTASPTAPPAEEGDLVVGPTAPQEGEETQAPLLTGEDIGNLESDEEQVSEESDGKVTGLDSYFGYVPSEVEVPKEVVDAFPEYHEGLAENTLAYLMGSNITADIQRQEVSEETFRLTYRGMETYLSEPMIEFTEENVNAYLAASNEEEMTDPFKKLWGIAPLQPKFSGWTDPGTGEVAKVDDTREWDARIDSFKIVGLGTGESQVDGVEVQFNRGVEIPLENSEYDMRVYQGFNITMIPGFEEGEWVVDSFAYKGHTIEEIPKLP